MPADAIVLDANLLVLLVVGTASRSYIAKHKRLDAYTEQDFLLLLELLPRTPRIIVTPNTVTETSNLIGRIAEPARTHVYVALRTLLKATDEIFIESTQAASHTAFPRLGVTDAVLLDIVTEKYTLLTANLDLYLEAARNKCKAINFTYLIAANR